MRATGQNLYEAHKCRLCRDWGLSINRTENTTPRRRGLPRRCQGSVELLFAHVAGDPPRPRVYQSYVPSRAALLAAAMSPRPRGLPAPSLPSPITRTCQVSRSHPLPGAGVQYSLDREGYESIHLINYLCSRDKPNCMLFAVRSRRYY